MEGTMIRGLTNEAAEVGNFLQVMSAQANFVSVLLDPEGWVLTGPLNASPMLLALCNQPFNCCSLTRSSQTIPAAFASFYGVDTWHAAQWLVPALAGAFKTW